MRVLIIGGSTGGVCVAQGSQATPRRTAQCWRLNDGKDVGEMAEHVEPGGVCARDHGHGVGEPLALLLARGQATDRSRAIELLEEALASPHAIGMVLVSEGIQRLQAAQAGGRVPTEPAAEAATVAEASRRHCCIERSPRATASTSLPRDDRS